MKIKLFRVFLFVFLIFLTSGEAFAEVITTEKTTDDSKYVYIAGNPNFYPLEYYNGKTERYEGALPEIINDVSEKTGINFAYIKGSVSQSELLENGDIQIVSSYITDYDYPYAADDTTVFSYSMGGKPVNIGFAFTDSADEKMIKELKSAFKEISPKELNGYLVMAQKLNTSRFSWGFLTTFLCIVFIAFVIPLFIYKGINTKKQMLHNKNIDDETGIGNVLYFEKMFHSLIPFFEKNEYYIAYIILDSNNLQLYHSNIVFADILKYTADVIGACEGENEVAARITENGFVFLYKSENQNVAENRIKEIVKKVALYLNSEDSETTSVLHTVFYNLNADDRNYETLVFNLRKNCIQLVGTEEEIRFCDAEMMNSDLIEKMFAQSILDGFKNKEFKLYLQFIINNESKKIVSAEALSRWESPEKGLLMPGQYIKAMESNGIISQLDYYMFETTCCQLHKWRDTEFEDLTISCNFTRITLSEEDFIEKIKEISTKYVFDKSKLIIEITEDAIEKNRDVAIENILECKKLGFRVALDDLGSGYTSLVNLCEYPIDIVKIDRNILLNTEKEKGKDLFLGVVALAHSLNLKVVCEGVETEEQNRFVSSSKCDYIQGWYYSKAQHSNGCEEFVRNYSVV